MGVCWQYLNPRNWAVGQTASENILMGRYDDASAAVCEKLNLFLALQWEIHVSQVQGASWIREVSVPYGDIQMAGTCKFACFGSETLVPQNKRNLKHLQDPLSCRIRPQVLKKRSLGPRRYDRPLVRRAAVTAGRKFLQLRIFCKAARETSCPRRRKGNNYQLVYSK